jgi:fumarate hydratase, class II
MTVQTEKYRIETDSLGEVKVPEKALYQAQTQRAIDNFKISSEPVAKQVIIALIDIKKMAAKANLKFDLLKQEQSKAIESAAITATSLDFPEQFPVSVLQTGSGTSSNMNVNEVLATLASQQSDKKVHPNDHVNLGQSSNDVFPSAIQIACVREVNNHLIPELNVLEQCLAELAKKYSTSIKNGRTHLMDATPITFGQEFDCWRQQTQSVNQRIKNSLAELTQLPLGGTAVGNGINTHKEFAKTLCAELTKQDNIQWKAAEVPAAMMSAQEHTLHLASSLKNIAVFLLKIANDLRWMNSGPVSGLSEIQLAKLQPGSSIMPGKVNPVIPEAIAMACADVIGNESSITIAAQSGNFQLNVMLPLIGNKLIQSIHLMSNSIHGLTHQVLKNLVVNEKLAEQKVAMNPILATALNPHIGYDAAAKIAKRAANESRSVIDIAREETNLSDAQLDRILNPDSLANGS